MPSALPKLTVYYGRKPGDMPAFLARVGNDILVVEPAFFTTAPTQNTYAYFSATGVNRTNKMLALLHKKLSDGGYLLGKDDPYGPGTSMVDMRKQSARDIMKEFVMEKLAPHFFGVLLDAIISAEIVQNDYPQYQGLLDGTLSFIAELDAALGPKKLIANSLMESEAAMRAIGKVADYVMCESQCAIYGELRTQSDNAWTIAKLKAVAAGAKKRSVGILFLEPGAGDAKKEIEKKAPAMIAKLITGANGGTTNKPLFAGGFAVVTAADFQRLEP